MFVVAARVVVVVVVGGLSEVELPLEEEVGTKCDTALTSSCARESAMDAACTKSEAFPEAVLLLSEVCCKVVLTREAMLAARTLTSTSATLELSVGGTEVVIDCTCGSVVETLEAVEDGGG